MTKSQITTGAKPAAKCTLGVTMVEANLTWFPADFTKGRSWPSRFLGKLLFVVGSPSSAILRTMLLLARQARESASFSASPLVLVGTGTPSSFGGIAPCGSLSGFEFGAGGFGIQGVASRHEAMLSDCSYSSNQFPESPSRLVGHSKLPLQLFSGHSVLAGRHEEDGEEPRLQARGGFVENGSRSRVNLMTTPLAGIAATIFDRMKAIGLAAFRASAASRILNLKHEVEARPVVGELCVELF
jgi:hypothetical protein